MRWRTRTLSGDLRIARARGRDHAALADLWWRAAAASHGFLGQDTLAEEHRALRDVYLPRCEVWIAGGHIPQGFIALGRPGQIAGLFVDPAAQGRGLGRKLLDHVRGAHPLQLEVAAPNFRARNFYARYGFTEVSRRRDPDLDEDLVQMFLAQTETETPT